MIDADTFDLLIFVAGITIGAGLEWLVRRLI